MNSLAGTKPNVKKILIVEDDLSLRPFWERFFALRSHNIEVDWSVSCEEAIKMIRTQNNKSTPYFMIITDIFLAGSQTGMELLASEEVIESHAKTVLVSAVRSDEIVEKFSDLIRNAIVISKPLDFKKLEVLLRDVFPFEQTHYSNGVA